MVESAESIIKKTVHFERPIKGSDLIYAVRSATGRDFYQNHGYNEGDTYRIGQRSMHPAEHLLVTPNDAEDFFRPEQFYDSAVVARHDHGGTTYAIRTTRDREIEAVENLADGLSRHLPPGLQGGGSRDPYAPVRGAVAGPSDGKAEPGPAPRDSGPSAESIIKKTVHFDRPIKGSDLVNAVRAACDEPGRPDEYGGRDFYQDHGYDDGHRYRIGQTSSHPDRHLLVRPNDTEDFFRPEQFYDSAVVVPHRHPGSAWAVRTSQDDKIAAVQDFADRLSRHLPAGRQDDAGRDPYAPARGAVTSHPETKAESGPWRRDAGPSAQPRGY
ncbi:hypothetical protein OHA18_10025 [Kribbella sp. NBC_00709]|uniref:hypothetical protein n=1 Tax=Kribbella sp. NBC_00709 TaxID=2975972 RepID=UPI002E2E0182|nr:hypothetical protein [Kribbella sp. NBC_00709]